jgi:hypothetical protein
MSDISSPKITKGDLESQLRVLTGDVQQRVVSKQRKIAMGAGVALVLVVLVTYVLGKRAGKRKMTFVEIRRV